MPSSGRRLGLSLWGKQGVPRLPRSLLPSSYVPPVFSLWNLPRRWEWLAEKYLDRRNLAQPPVVTRKPTNIPRGAWEDERYQNDMPRFWPSFLWAFLFSSISGTVALASPRAASPTTWESISGHTEGSGNPGDDTKEEELDVLHGATSTYSFSSSLSLHLLSPLLLSLLLTRPLAHSARYLLTPPLTATLIPPLTATLVPPLTSIPLLLMTKHPRLWQHQASKALETHSSHFQGHIPSHSPVHRPVQPLN